MHVQGASCAISYTAILCTTTVSITYILIQPQAPRECSHPHIQYDCTRTFLHRRYKEDKTCTQRPVQISVHKLGDIKPCLEMWHSAEQTCDHKHYCMQWLQLPLTFTYTTYLHKAQLAVLNSLLSWKWCNVQNTSAAVAQPTYPYFLCHSLLDPVRAILLPSQCCARCSLGMPYYIATLLRLLWPYAPKWPPHGNDKMHGHCMLPFSINTVGASQSNSSTPISATCPLAHVAEQLRQGCSGHAVPRRT